MKETILSVKNLHVNFHTYAIFFYLPYFVQLRIAKVKRLHKPWTSSTYVVNQGTPLANGTPEQIRNNPDVIRAYLGEA